MAKEKSFDQLFAEQVERIEDHAPKDAKSLAGIFGIPDWVYAQAAALVFSLIKGLAKTDSAKAKFRAVVVKIVGAARASYPGDADIDCV